MSITDSQISASFTRCVSTPDGSAESEALSKLDPETARYVSERMEQEMLSIDRERARLEQAMKGQIQHVKQQILHDICRKIQEKGSGDTRNAATHQEMFPDVFGLFSQRSTRQQPRKKLKLQKPSFDLSKFEMEISWNQKLLDLTASQQKTSEIEQESSDLAVLVTRQGQKWIVKKSDMGNGVTKLSYCDGSSSLITDEDAKSLGLSFLPVPKA
jgi:exonuclease VII large subunit